MGKKNIKRNDLCQGNLLEACVKNNEQNQLLSVLENARNDGVTLTSTILSAIVKSFIHNKQTDKALSV